MLKAGLRGTTRWLCLAMLVAVVLPFSIAAQDSEPYPLEAGSDVVGKLRPVSHPTSLNNVPVVHQQIMEANLQRFVAIVLRDPALRPPVGFDFRTGTHAYAPPQPVSLHPPLAYTMTGLFYWYAYLPAVRRIEPIPGQAMGGFYVRANDISTVFDDLERWTLDERGLTYAEPREIRRVAGFPQYSTGVVVLKRNPRPIWVPISREWALQRELDQRRKNLDSIAESAKAAEAYDPTAILEKWLGERPERQREMEKSYAEMKQSNPEYAEKIRTSFSDTEKRVEEALRYTAEREKATPPRFNARLAAERSGEEKCIRYLESELARLTAAERAAPAYLSTRIFDSKQSSPGRDCSCIVDADFPDARRLVTENPDYYDQDLPPSAIQLILVDFRLSQLPGEISWHHAAYERVRDGLDYAALAAMLQE